jgi:hypothetical protein
VQRPKIDREYTLVRRDGETVRVAKYTRYDDGSGMVVADGYVSVFELDPHLWRRKWDELIAQGYVEVREAIASGLVSEGEVPG